MWIRIRWIQGEEKTIPSLSELSLSCFAGPASSVSNEKEATECCPQFSVNCQEDDKVGISRVSNWLLPTDKLMSLQPIFRALSKFQNFNTLTSQSIYLTLNVAKAPTGLWGQEKWNFVVHDFIFLSFLRIVRFSDWKNKLNLGCNTITYQKEYKVQYLIFIATISTNDCNFFLSDYVVHVLVLGLGTQFIK